MGLLTWLGLATPGEPVAVGAEAPEVTAPDETGKSFCIADFYQKGYTLIFFFPKADTPGCTAQACSLRDEYTELQLRKVQIVGVSADAPDALATFKEKNRLPFPLLRGFIIGGAKSHRQIVYLSCLARYPSKILLCLIALLLGL